MKLNVGTTFNTLFEEGNVVTVPPGVHNALYPQSFLAVATDGVECEYVTAMVIGHPDFYDPTV